MDRFPIEWRGNRLSLGYIDVKFKERFCEWLYDYLTDQACEQLARRKEVLSHYLDKLFADKPWWGAGRFSHHVQTALNGEDGGIMYTRLLLGESGKLLSDTDIQALIEDKETEQRNAEAKREAEGLEGPHPQINDYSVAMAKIMEHEFPKAGPVSGSGPDPTAGTTTTGTS